MLIKINVVAGIVSGIIGILAFLPSIIAIKRKEWRPNPISWWVWTIINTIAVIASWVKGADSAVILFGAFAIGDLIISIMSLRFVFERKWSIYDKASALLAVISITLWVVFSSASMGLIFSMIAGYCGTFPQLRDLWRREIVPKKMEKIAWSMFALSAQLNLFAVVSWSLIDWGKWIFAVDGAFGNIVLTLLVLIPMRPFKQLK